MWHNSSTIAFDWYLDPKLYNLSNYESVSIHDYFKIKYKPITRKVGNFREELGETAKFVRESTSKDIIITLSGGIDSEIICRAFFDAKIQFSALLVDTGVNDYDLIYAKNFCKKHDIKHIVLNLDMIWFLSEGYKKYANQGFRTACPFKYFYIWLIDTIDNLGGSAVLGLGTFQDSNMIYTPTSVAHKVNTGYVSFINYKSEHNKHFPFFLQTTPELTYSFINDPLMSCLINNPKYFCVLSGGIDKQIVYRSHFPIMEQRPKYTGIENIKEVWWASHYKLIESFPETKITLALDLQNIRSELENNLIL